MTGADERKAAITALVKQLEDLMEDFVVYGWIKGDQALYWATADGQRYYATLGLLEQARSVTTANQDREIRAAVHNAILAEERAKASGGDDA